MGRRKPRIAERSVSAPARGYPPGLKVERVGDNEFALETQKYGVKRMKR